jgi:anti-sigma B factor antagonist
MANAIDVARHENTVYALVVGLGNFNNAGPFREFADAMIHSGARNIVIDLGQCTGLDSTFLGTLMGFLTTPLHPGGPAQDCANPAVHVTLVNLTPVTDRAITSLGLKCILDVRDRPVEVPPLNLRRLRDGWDNPEQRIMLIKEAHEHLVRHDQGNREKFGPFIQMLLKDLGGGATTTASASGAPAGSAGLSGAPSSSARPGSAKPGGSPAKAQHLEPALQQQAQKKRPQ